MHPLSAMGLKPRLHSARCGWLCDLPHVERTDGASTLTRRARKVELHRQSLASFEGGSMCAASRDASFDWGSMCAAGDSPDFQEIPVWSVDFQEDSEEVALCSIIALCAAKKLREENKARKEWCKPWLSRRPLRGSYSHIFSELELENPSDFENYTRMPITAFHDILKRIHPYIVKEDTRLRESISPLASAMLGEESERPTSHLERLLTTTGPCASAVHRATPWTGRPPKKWQKSRSGNTASLSATPARRVETGLYLK